MEISALQVTARNHVRDLGTCVNKLTVTQLRVQVALISSRGEVQRSAQAELNLAVTLRKL